MAVNNMSLSTFLTHIVDEEGKVMSLGTSFPFRHEGRLWLVTAGHNVSGRHAETGMPMPPFHEGTYPRALRPHVPGLISSEPPISYIQWIPVDIPLWTDDASHFVVHPRGLAVDVAAVDIADRGEFHHIHAVNDPFHDHVNYAVSVSEDVFILGYPEGITGGGKLPIWKRGTIASEPDNLDFIYVDTASRGGMSGAPVLTQRTGITHPIGVQSAPGQLAADSLIGTVSRFLGIYTSRSLADNAGILAQIGKIYKESVIQETIAEGRLFEPQ